MKDYPFAFSIFDTIAYLAVGFLFWFIVILAIPFLNLHLASLLKGSNISSPFILIPAGGLASYISGQVFAYLGRLFFENLLIEKRLGYPSDNFFSCIVKAPSNNEDSPPNKQAKALGKLFNWLTLNYKKPFSNGLAQAIRSKYTSLTSREFTHQDAFYFCFHYVKEKSPTSYSRFLAFLQIYSFCRNMCVVFILASVGVLVSYFFCLIDTSIHPLILFAVFLILGIILFIRYLHFFRLCGEEIFRCFYTLTIDLKN